MTTTSYEKFTLATETLNVFIDSLSSYTSDISIEYDQIISIVSNCSHLINYININQYVFIEYAIDDYLYLDENFDLIYQKVFEILNHLNSLTKTNVQIYNLEKTLQSYLPSTYLNEFSSALSSQITSTLIEQTSQIFMSSYDLLSNNLDDDNNDSVMSSSFLFSSLPIFIGFENSDATKNLSDSYHYTGSLLQLDKINLRTGISSHSPRMPFFPFDFDHLQQIEHDLGKKKIFLYDEAFIVKIINNI